MEIATPLSATPLLAPFDGESRMLRSLSDDHDRARAASADTRGNLGQNGEGSTLNTIDGMPTRLDDAEAQSTRSEHALLSLDETTQLFKTRLEEARKDSQYVFEASDAVDDAVKPKLTLDLGHADIARLPEGVVDLIKAEVERLSLSHNQIWHIPLRFAECTQLRYLNIKCNVFREIPRGVYKLPLLEILDISKNKIRKISREIKNLTSLRVFSIIHNRVDDLPLELCEMSKLQILKVAENPLRFKLKKIIESKEAEVQDLQIPESEKEHRITSEIKRHLREISRLKSMDTESGGEFSEGPGDTPRPQRRVTNSRFPVIPSRSSTSELTSDGPASSPSSIRAPPIPTRSHFRMTSGQQVPVLRRPGLSPLVSNERNRSNSESVLQASNAARTRRTILKKDRPDLDTVDENKLNRFSHLRGYSHGSALRGRNSIAPGSPSLHPASPHSPRDVRRHREGLGKRLSSLPEHKAETESPNSVVNGATGVLYALYQVHPHISGLISILNGKDVRRSNLETVFYNASSHFEALNESIEIAKSVDIEDLDAIETAEDAVQRDCAACIAAYAHVAGHLSNNVRKIINRIDARYVRTLMLMLYGCMVEIKNAISSFGIETYVGKQSPVISKVSDSTYLGPLVPAQPYVRNGLPRKPAGLVSEHPAGRLRSQTTIQHPILEDFIAYPPNPPFAQSYNQPRQRSRPSTPLTGSTLNGLTYHESKPSYASNGSSGQSTNGAAVPRSSRSNSRNGNFIYSNVPSLTSSLASTPRSGEPFDIPATSEFNSQVNPLTGMNEAQEEACFEKIWHALSKTYMSANRSIPHAKAMFIKCVEAYEENSDEQRAVSELWRRLIWRCQSCLDASENLHLRLMNMRLKDHLVTTNGLGSGRNDPSFWQLWKTFMQNFVELATEMKQAKGLKRLPTEMIAVLRPVQKASQEAGRLIDASPWRQLADAAAGGPVVLHPRYQMHHPQTSKQVMGNAFANGTTHGTAYGNAQSHQAHKTQPTLQKSPFPPPIIPVPPVPGNVTNGVPLSASSASSAATNGISPVSVPLPATPLSAALGPAAQATIPSTPNLSSGEQIFQGNVFQRADTLLNMSQSGNVNFLNRR